MSTIGDFLAELVKAELDKCLIETIKECASHPDKPIKVTDTVIKLTNEELEEIFDKIDASEEEREVWKNVYYYDLSNINKSI